MKRLYLLLSITSLVDGRFASRPHSSLQTSSHVTASFFPVRSITPSILLRLRGGESDLPDKRRKKRRRPTNKAAPDAERVILPADVSSEETIKPSIDGERALNDGAKKRRRRRDFMTNMMFKDRSAYDTSSDAAAKQSLEKKRKRRTVAESVAKEVEPDLDKASGLDSPMKKKKRRKKKITAVEPNVGSDASNNDAPAGLDEDNDIFDVSPTATVKKRRRKKRSIDVTDNVCADEPSDIQEIVAEINANHDEPNAVGTFEMKDEHVKMKKRRKKRKNVSESTSERQLPSLEDGTSTETSDSIYTVDTPLDEQLVNEQIDDSLLLASDAAIKVQEVILEGEAPSEQSVQLDTTIEAQEVVLESEANDDFDASQDQSISFGTSTEAIVSIDATIEIPGEEVVPESIFSSVEVDDSLAAGGDEQYQIGLSEQIPEELPATVEMSTDFTEAESSASHLDLDDGVPCVFEELQSDISDQNEREDFVLQSVPVSVESAIEIHNEEVVPESISSAVAIDESVCGAELKEDDLESLGMSAEIAFERQEKLGVGIGSDDDMEDIREEDVVEYEVRDEVEGNDKNDESRIDDNDETAGQANGESDSGVVHSEEEEQESTLQSLSDEATADEPIENEDAAEPKVQDNSLSHENTSDVAFPTCTNTEDVVSDSPELSVIAASNDDDKECITLSVVTWNLGEAPPSEKEASFIRQFRNGSDLVMIGAQECEDIKPRRSEGHRSRHLRRLGILMLGEQYVPLAIHSLGGIQMALYCRREKLDDIEFIGLADVTCGVGNVFHNKGAIGVYLKLKHRIKDSDNAKSSKLLLVTGHLAAHVKNVDARNNDFRLIMTELEAQAPARFLRPKKNRDGSILQGDGSYLLNSMDHVIFSGDLNYRVDLPREYVDRCIDEIKICQLEDQLANQQSDVLMNKLLRRDQLLRTISSGRAFSDFNEGKIAFLPTFKFDKGTSDYDTSYKQRIPAWTDRILFKSNNIKVLKYDSVPNAMHSDHRPVFGTFLLGWGNVEATEKKSKRKTSRR